MLGIKKGAVLAIAMIACTACSNNELSRTEAAKVVQDEAKNHAVKIWIDLGSASPKRMLAARKCNTGRIGGKEQDDTFFANLESAGYIKKVHYNHKISIGRGRFKQPTRYKKGYVCQLTEKGKHEILLPPTPGKDYNYTANLRVGKRIVDEVTGITFNQEKTQAKVLFAYHVEKDGAGTKAPVNFAQKDKYWQKTFTAKALSGSALVVLYDDGWRVETVDFKQNNRVY